MDAYPQENDTDFVVLADGNGIDVFDPNKTRTGTNLIQNGTDFASNWTCQDASSNVDGWLINDSSSGLAAYSDDETSSLINTFASLPVSGITYRITFTVGVAKAYLAFGGRNGDDGTDWEEEWLAAAFYEIGTHTIEFTPTTGKTHLWIKATTSSSGASTIDSISMYASGWHDRLFNLGSQTASVKPSFFYVDGALRACDGYYNGILDSGAHVASADLIQEGAFNGAADDDDPWVTATGWAYDTSNDYMTYNGTNDAALLKNMLKQPYLKKGKTYSLTFTTALNDMIMSIEDGNGNELVASATYATGSSPHTVSFTVSAADSQYIAFKGNATTSDSGSRLSAVSMICTDAGIDVHDTNINFDDGSAGAENFTIGELIQIDEEIMYIAETASSAKDVEVIRGFANTKIQKHADNTQINYVNVPKYFGHIKKDRFFESEFSDSINDWVRDVQTPQPPNNTRKGCLSTENEVDSYLAKSGQQSLRVYDNEVLPSPTSNFPGEGEKVRLDFGISPPEVGIIATTFDDDANQGNMLIETSASHNFQVGQTVVLSNLDSDIIGLSGPSEVLAIGSPTTFYIDVEGASASYTKDWSPDGGSTPETYSATWSGIAKHSGTYVDRVTATVDESDVPGLASAGNFWIHTTGQTGVEEYNGVKLAKRESTTTFSFVSQYPDITSQASGTTETQQLMGTISTTSGTMEEDLKRKWAFAMSFIYDGPSLEFQESLLTNGFCVEPCVTTAGLPIELDLPISTTSLTDDDKINVDTGHQIVSGDVLLIDDEQMKVVSEGTSNYLDVIRGYNGSTAVAHDDLSLIHI